ncbi:pentatricopeptide repeat-containing protein At4g13650 [Selaginella moellendorffii]|uniref:pentatricopeptide repeat-containing protein At4g13650 n=1 Tax=Selaginella moellendorffii TaxID=88036 RepID=UPI000D1CA447|nr:pentatricopeptide repeat-containing protein At4g13650 [Selaginella moellendorffii]|eukprot:XP_024533193.1 pentatricopeptide repeat-containing protein At4g13650 [Selaginella moellendorffii]
MIATTTEIGTRCLATSSLSLDAKSLATAIKECTSKKSVLEVHTRIVEHGLGGDLFLSSAIVHRYLSCGSVWDAWNLFSRLHERDVITWTRLIAAFAQKGHLQPALLVFREMLLQGVFADSITFVTLLNCCAKFRALDQGREMHTYVLEKGFDAIPRVGNSLVDLYAKCGCLDDACVAFASLWQPDVISWNTLIAAYASCSGFTEALGVYRRMELEGMKPDAFTLVTILNACSDPATIASSIVKEMHERIVSLGVSCETVVCNALVSMYGNGGQLTTARSVFEDSCASKDVISWNAIISGYTLAGLNSEALRLYRKMQLEGQLPNDVAFLSIMNACTGPVDLYTARLIHSNVEESFATSGSRENEAQVRNALRTLSMATATLPLSCTTRMQLEGFRPTNVTFTTVLNACSESFLERGRMIHANLVGTGYESTDVVVSALVDMYCKCGGLEEAHRIFAKHSRRGVVLWTAIIGGYSDAGDSRAALHLFKQMLLDGTKPNKVTFVTVLNACANSQALPPEEVALVRCLVAQSGHEPDFAVKNALLNLFGKSGSLQDVEKTFEELDYCWDVIAGTVMVSAYSQLGLWRKSLELYHRILLEGMKPSPTTFVAALTSCSSLATLPVGKAIHATIAETGCSSIPLVQSSLINFYGKCGSLKLARRIFEAMDDKTMVNSWTAVITGYAQHGEMEHARKIFERMQQEGVKPDEVTFINVLSACSHAGIVEDACYFFIAMTQELGLAAGIEHYGCLIDLLGRSGWLNEAEALVKKMTVQPDSVLWSSLLGSSRVHGNVKVAKHAAQRLIELEPENAASYVQLSNTYTVWKPCDAATRSA